MRYHKELYKQHSSGKIGSWTIQVIDDAAIAGYCQMVVSVARVVGGKMKHTVTKYDHSMVASQNNPIEQAVFDAKSKVKKKVDNGYVESIEAAEAPVTNGLGFKKPMLAKPRNKVKKAKPPFYGQPKLDGHRCIATIKDGSVVLYSRQGNLINQPIIASEWQNLYDTGSWDGTPVDGELYVHNKHLQQITSLIKDHKKDLKGELGHHIYDVMLDVPFAGRIAYIKKLNLEMRRAIRQTSRLQFVHTVLLHNEYDVSEFHSENLANDYEGTILREPVAVYEDGKRSSSLLKVKEFTDDEFEIVGVVKGKSTYSGGQKYEVAIYECATGSGKHFRVTAPGNATKKHQAWLEKDNAIGKMLTIQYFSFTPDGVPFHPVAIRIREDF